MLVRATNRVAKLTRPLSWLALAAALVCAALLVVALVQWRMVYGVPLLVIGIPAIGAALFALLLSLFDPSDGRRGVRLRAGLALVVLVVVLVLGNVLSLAR